MGNLFVRTGIVFLLIGMTAGMYMGAMHDFTYAPAHAHLNLVGGVLMMITGFIYNSRPNMAPKLAPIHYGINVIGVPVMVVGVAGAQVHAAWFPPVVGIGSIAVFVATLMLAWVVFTAYGRKAD